MSQKTMLSALQELQSRYESFQNWVALENHLVSERQKRLQDHNDRLVAKIAVLQEEIKEMRETREVSYFLGLIEQ